jgi:hydroxyacylglutathione hydrolase
VIKIGKTVELECLDTPGHTMSHICVRSHTDTPALFCGDTLFALGCGRLLEGDAPTMWASLTKLMGLPDDTRVYCGHEYTQSNARFALSVDLDNERLTARAREVDRQRAAGAPTVPSALGDEKVTNPFLRASDPYLQARLGLQGAPDADVFAELRRRKDSFR